MPSNRQALFSVAALILICQVPAARCASGPILVPLDSWVYPALARLWALGYVTSQASGLRPWTRQECIRQLVEAKDALARPVAPSDSASATEASRLVGALTEEFSRDEISTGFLELESVYARYLGIAGKPLADGYNFGQTVINDYGRPLAGGANFIGGFSAAASAGRWSWFTRAEFQHSPALFSPARELKSTAAQLEPVLPDTGSGTDRFLPLEMYGGVQIGAWSLTVGKQGLWWGPGESGPLSFSNNAEPFYSFRLTHASPIILPGFLRRVGGFRLDFVGGRLEGHQVPPRPLFNGQRVTWNPLKNLELGFTRWSLFGGEGVSGLNLRSVARNFFANGATFGNAVDPGDRKSGFDFRWRLPMAGKFVTLYSDFYADDEPSPLASPRRSAFNPGIYLPRLPGLSRWDLRVEAPSTRVAGDDQGGFFLYWNNVYNNANTNSGRLLGNWVGRDGRGLFVQTTYWHTPRSRLGFSYRQNRIGSAFLPGGGTQNAGSVTGAWQVKPDWILDSSLQFERYFIPLLGGPRHDLAATIRMTYLPRWRSIRR